VICQNSLKGFSDKVNHSPQGSLPPGSPSLQANMESICPIPNLTSVY